MNILLTTHNFYPHHWGGTEVYVLHLAKYLIGKGHDVKIVAAIDGKNSKHYSSIYQDEFISICKYTYENIPVYGIHYHLFNTYQIYTKYSHRHHESWKKFISKEDSFQQIDILHVNGFTATIGLDLIYTINNSSPNVSIITSYHTPILDPKETLTYGNKLVERPKEINPLADLLSYRFNLAYRLTKAIATLTPSIYSPYLPSIFNIKYYINQSIQSMNILIGLTNEWWVYSESIKKHLISYGIPSKKIQLQRHGITKDFIGNKNIANGPIKFLYSGRLSKGKGIVSLLKAWLKLDQTDKKILWITANPLSPDPTIQKWIKKSLKRIDIVWLGEIEQKQLADYYSKANYVIIPSEWFEIGPMVFHEAIAAGCHVITTDIGGCKELGMYYGNTTIFKTGDVNALAQIIKTCNGSNNTKPLHQPINFDEHFDQLFKSSLYQQFTPI